MALGGKKKISTGRVNRFFLLQENLSVNLLALLPWRLVEVESTVLLSNTVNKNDLWSVNFNWTGKDMNEAEIADKDIISWVFLSVVTCIWACSLQGPWKLIPPMECSGDTGFLPTAMWMSLTAGVPAPGKPSDDYVPADNLVATRSQNHLAKLLLDSWPSDTVLLSVCCFKLLNLEVVSYMTIDNLHRKIIWCFPLWTHWVW